MGSPSARTSELPGPWARRPGRNLVGLRLCHLCHLWPTSVVCVILASRRAKEGRCERRAGKRAWRRWESGWGCVCRRVGGGASSSHGRSSSGRRRHNRPRCPSRSPTSSRSPRQRVPHMAFEYVAAGAGDELTMRDNQAAFDRSGCSRACSPTSSRVDMRLTLFGHARSTFPILLAPTAYHRLVHPEGELATARGAAAAGAILVAELVRDHERRGHRQGRAVGPTPGACGFSSTSTRPRLHPRARPARRGGRLRGALHHRRHADHRPPPSRDALGVRAAAGHRAANLKGLGAGTAALHIAIRKARSTAPSSTRRSPGRASSGCVASPASRC